MASMWCKAASAIVRKELIRKTYFFDARTLYSLASLGIDNYVTAREKVVMQFQNMEDKYKQKMRNFTDPESTTNMIFTEDLKHMLHLVLDSEEDLNLVEKMMVKFNQQNKELRFGQFVFGPVVMRMYHYLNKPAEALKVFKNPLMDGFFDQLMSYQVLMDLLFINGMYNEIVEVFNIVKEKQLQGAKYPRHSIVLLFAAFYKLNTPEMLKMASEVWAEMLEVGHNPMRRTATFAAALAINQNAPHIALEILSTQRQPSYVTTRNLKAAALSDLGRPEDAIPLLRSVLEEDQPHVNKGTIASDVLDKLRAAVETAGNKEIAQEFQRVEEQLMKQGHISNESLDSLLCRQIESYNPQLRDNRMLDASFTQNTRGRRRDNYYQQRPGLRDLV